MLMLICWVVIFVMIISLYKYIFFFIVIMINLVIDFKKGIFVYDNMDVFKGDCVLFFFFFKG